MSDDQTPKQRWVSPGDVNILRDVLSVPAIRKLAEEVIERLNSEYYAVHFDAESDSVVNFGGRDFINDQLEKSRNPLHQIAQLLALREGQFVAPTMVILDEKFRVTARYFEYLDSKRLLKALE